MPTKLLLTAFIYLSFSFTKLHAQKVNEGSIPAEFKCPDCILLIVKKENGEGIPGFNKHVEKIFKKQYSGKFEVVAAKDIDTNSLYKDKAIYRFILGDNSWSVSSKHSESIGPQDRNHQYTTTATYISFHLYDRQLEKGYPEIGVWHYPVTTVEHTAKALDEKYK